MRTEPGQRVDAPQPERDPGLDLPLRLSLVYLLLHPGVLWIERLPVVVLAGWGLLHPASARRPWLWLGAAAWTAFPVLWHWPRSDNHAYLVAYWCLALGCALSTQQPAAVAARSAGLLVGLTFAFATLWKAVLSPDFVSGAFFRTTLLLDARFADVALLLGGMSPEAFARNEQLLEAAWRDGAAGPALVEPARLVALAYALTAWTLFSEAFVAVSFLWPGRRLPAWLRDAALLLFCTTTFAVATVAPFGALLATLGLAQCAPGRRRTRLLYVGSFFLVLAYAAVPWSGYLVSWED